MSGGGLLGLQFEETALVRDPSRAAESRLHRVPCQMRPHLQGQTMVSAATTRSDDHGHCDTQWRLIFDEHSVLNSYVCAVCE